MGALAQGSDAFFYAAAPVAGEAGWAIVYKEDHEQTVLQEDGATEKKQTINEPANLKVAIDTGKKPNGGLWLGGEKFAITQYNANEEIAEKSCVYLFANKPKKGVHMIKTPGDQIIAGFYNEEKGQASGNAKRAVVAFAEYMIGMESDGERWRDWMLNYCHPR